MLGSLVMGRNLDWHPIGEIPGSWAYSLEGDTIAEFWWSPENREVRAEAGTQVWRIMFRGTFLLRAVVVKTEHDTPQLFFAGGIRRGLARCQNGPRFTLFTQLDRKLGPWAGIDDEQGTAILRVQGRVGEGTIWCTVKVTPDPRYTFFAEPLLLLWGGLQVLRQKYPWLTLTTVWVSEGATQREIEHLLASEGP